MIIVSWNVNGIRSNVLSRGKFTGTLEPDSNLAEIITGHDPDIICFQETKCEELEIDKADVYHKYWSSSSGTGARAGNRYSGTSIWTKQLPEHVMYDLPTLSLPEAEGRIIVMRFGTFTLINTYVPNGGTNFEYRTTVWDEAVAEYLSILREDGVNVIWTGDMNVARTKDDIFAARTASKAVLEGIGPNAWIGFTKEERDGFEKILSLGYSDVFRELHPDANEMFTWWNLRIPTCRTQNKGWRIDYFIVSDWMMESIVTAKVLLYSGLLSKPSGSDHAAIMMEINV